jgi:D-galactarolactone cycloisomerase
LKIIDVIPYVLEAPLDKPFAYSQAWCHTRMSLIVEIQTDEGVTGFGEAFGPSRIHQATIQHVYRPRILGRDPLDTDAIWEDLYNCLRDHGQKGLSVEALSAIDIALWDIKGKSTGLPVHKLAGGALRTHIQPYATGLYYRESPDLIAERVREAEGYISDGFQAMKLKIGHDVQEDIRQASAIRKAIGADCKLAVDANHAYNAATAISVGRALEEFDIAWFEEPVTPEDYDGYQEVRGALDIPISGGEAEFTRFGFRELISRRCVDIVQPDCCVMGGISEALRVAAMANTWHLQCMPHVWGSAIGFAAALQFAATIPHNPPGLHPQEPMFEWDHTENPLRQKLVEESFDIVDGMLAIPTRPGLGVTVNREILQQYSV